MEKIVIIKLGALGDVVRTLPVLPALKKKFPQSEITWITKKSAITLFDGNPYVNHVTALPFATDKTFDRLYNFDIDKEATYLAESIKARTKYGFHQEGDYVSSYTLGGEYYLNTLFDDETKKHNKKTYQEMMFEIAELPYHHELSKLYLNAEDTTYAQAYTEKNKLSTKNLIGIHMGASPRWPSKVWHESCLEEFIQKAKSKGYEVILFAGPDEIVEQKRVLDVLARQNVHVYVNDPHNTIKQFASLVNLCRIIICSDSFALHMALALDKPTIGLFFCTPPAEVETYGRLTKLVSPLLYKFFPEKMDQYNEDLVKSISAEQVWDTVGKNLQRKQ